MYGLDINFLKDRGLDTTVEIESKSVSSPSSLVEKLPIIGGGIAALVLPAVMFIYAQSFDTKQAKVKQEIQNIETQIAEIQGQSKSFEELEAQVKQANAETEALVSVFTKIRPWSAIVQEIGDRTPGGVQINSIQQSGGGNNISIQIGGMARSYSEVNDFVLFLKNSPFFEGKKIIMGTTSLAGIPIEIENKEDLPENLVLTFPEGVKYSITAQLANMPTTVLVKELNNKGSVGLITRLKTLESKGVKTK
ncbi:MAG: PilN domain-containing protein [Xenococcaceae cyanobacterium MO_167.B27]|nr:PilN domain-containing protein [Xenococcaceae cyanobacterium MO_167.B27]